MFLLVEKVNKAKQYLARHCEDEVKIIMITIIPSRFGLITEAT